MKPPREERSAGLAPSGPELKRSAAVPGRGNARELVRAAAGEDARAPQGRLFLRI